MATILAADLGDQDRILAALGTTRVLACRCPQTAAVATARDAHLSRLKVAGLVEPHRMGKKISYRLSPAGESLLGLFGELA